MSRLLLFIVLGGFLTYGITNLSLNDSVTRGTENSVTSFSYNQARNIANSTVQMIFSHLGDDINWRVTSPATIDLYGGYATYTVTSVTQSPGDDDDDDDDGDDDSDGDDDDDDSDGDDDDDDSDGGGSGSSSLYQEIKIAVTAYYNGVTKSVTVFAKGLVVNNVELPVS